MEQSEAASDPSAGAHPYLVAQATGVLMSQFAISPDAAFEKLRAESAYLDRHVADVAGEIVENLGLRPRGSERR